ncbi:Thiamin-phosphate pyrophosphorylase [Minicystis rosea]|nr:Thiamin-phosphate pyrophosphorylase [Minicystis rosea]
MRPRVLQITAADVLPERALFDRLEAIASLPDGARRGFAVQLRDPELDTRALFDLGARLRVATRAVGAALVVNDRLDLALALGADGVHLGRRSVSVADARALLGSSMWISVACHAVTEVVHAAEAGADAAVLSPIFASPGKGTPLGVSALVEARASLTARGLDVQVVALGGITAEETAACFAVGASAVAAIRADLTGVLSPVLDASARSC